jgi:hypothetical protein
MPDQKEEDSAITKALKRVLNKIVGPSPDMKEKEMNEYDKQIPKVDRQGNIIKG